MALIENPRAVYGLFAILSQRNKLKTAAVCFAALIFSGLLVKEWLAVKEADAIEAKSGRPPRKADPGFAATMADIFDFKPMHAQERFFYRVRAGDLYQPDPMIQKLDLDDPKIALEYQRDVTSFTKRLRELNIDINTVLVKPNPANIRVLTLQEGNPVKVWTLYLLTGEDTAQQLDDGIHLRRRGFADKIVGWPVGEKDERGYSEASSSCGVRTAGEDGMSTTTAQTRSVGSALLLSPKLKKSEVHRSEGRQKKLPSVIWLIAPLSDNSHGPYSPEKRPARLPSKSMFQSAPELVIPLAWCAPIHSFPSTHQSRR